MEIKAEGISKRYIKHWIIRNFEFHFRANKIYGISGPNGSGKTTLLSILAGLMPPTKGQVKFIQGDIEIPELSWYKYLSFAAPYAQVFEYLNLNELVSHHMVFKKFNSSFSASEFIDLCYFQGSEEKYIRSFSSGMKQRLKLGLALCTQSDIVFLDEPQTNLDDKAKQWYLDVMKAQSKGRLIIIASNDNSDFEICDEVIAL